VRLAGIARGGRPARHARGECREMVGRARFERATNWLKASCSTD
jgi:hypothetical protein